MKAATIVGNVVALAAGTLFALLVAEGALRVTGHPPDATMPDSTIGVRWRPHAPYRWTSEGFSEGRFNGHGWRDREHAWARPAGTSRVLFVGDSFVQALEVPLDSAFFRRLERDLDRREPPGRHAEVIALGRAGCGTTDELLMYRRWGKLYDPQVVALLFIANDWSDNWNNGDDIRPRLEDDGDSLRLDTSFLAAPRFRKRLRLSPLKAHSSLVTFVADALQRWRARVKPTATEAGLTGAVGWYQAWNLDRHPPADSVPQMRLTAKILGKFAREVAADGRRFVVFLPPLPESVSPELLAARVHDPNFDPWKIERFLEEAGAREGFEVVSLRPVFESYFRSGGPSAWYGKSPAYGHWNARGHALGERAMLDWFLAQPLFAAGGAAATR